MQEQPPKASSNVSRQIFILPVKWVHRSGWVTDAQAIDKSIGGPFPFDSGSLPRPEPAGSQNQCIDHAPNEHSRVALHCGDGNIWAVPTPLQHIECIHSSGTTMILEDSILELFSRTANKLVWIRRVRIVAAR
jgi:hypothetical protein